MKKTYKDLVSEMSKKFSGMQEYEQSVSDSLFNGLRDNVKTAHVVSQALSEDVDMLADPNKIKVASLADLFSFNRVDSSTLVHKSTKDLWSIEADNKGEVHITRLFDSDSGKPIQV